MTLAKGLITMIIFYQCLGLRINAPILRLGHYIITLVLPLLHYSYGRSTGMTYT